MKSYLARTALFSLSLVAGAALAKPYQSLDGIKAEFTAKGSTRYASAAATVDYGRDTMEVTLKPLCNPEESCDDNASATYSFESVNSTVNRCGVVQTVAVMDYIPVDGTRTQVTLTDASQYSCRGPKPVAATLKFEQKWYDRINGKWIQLQDRFQTNFVETMIQYEAVIRAELKSLSSKLWNGGSLFMDGRKNFVQLTLKPVDGSDEQVLEFDNATTTVNDCGIIQTVAQRDDRPVDGPFLKVTINNNRNNTCPTFAPLNALDVYVDQIVVSRLEGRTIETQDSLKADDFALIKPGK